VAREVRYGRRDDEEEDAMDDAAIEALIRSRDEAKVAEGLARATEEGRCAPLLELYLSLARICYEPEAVALTAARVHEMNVQVEPDLVPRDASSIEAVTELDLGAYPEARFLPELLRYRNLARLTLWDNTEQFPLEVTRLPWLKYLSIHDYITSIPPQIAEMSGLEELDLSSNKLTELCPEMRHLRNLRRLDLRCNWISELPAWLAELPALRILDVRDNGELESSVVIPEALASRAGLTILSN
jgi:hypothetical protein